MNLAVQLGDLMALGPNKIVCRAARRMGKTSAAAQLRAEYPNWRVYDDDTIEQFANSASPAVGLYTPRADNSENDAIEQAAHYVIVCNAPPVDTSHSGAEARR